MSWEVRWRLRVGLRALVVERGILLEVLLEVWVRFGAGESIKKLRRAHISRGPREKGGHRGQTYGRRLGGEVVGRSEVVWLRSAEVLLREVHGWRLWRCVRDETRRDDVRASSSRGRRPEDLKMGCGNPRLLQDVEG